MLITKPIVLFVLMLQKDTYVFYMKGLKGDNLPSVISKKESTAFKGLLSVLVMLCHCRSYIHVIEGMEIINQIFIAFGYISVGTFFFLSGYGVHESYLKKEGYIDSFLRNRVIPLYTKYIILVIGYAALLYIGGTLKPELIIPSFFIWGGLLQ